MGQEDDLEDIPAAVRLVAVGAEVRAALADLFRRNCRDNSGAGAPLPAGAAEALAEEAVEQLLHPDTCRLADVGRLRLHLEVRGEPYPGPSRIHASAWDAEGEVWRHVGEVVLPDPPAGV